MRVFSRRHASLALLTALSLGACATSESETGSTVQEVTTNVVRSKSDLFAQEATYFVRIANWDGRYMTPASLNDERMTAGSSMRLYKTAISSGAHCPDGEVSDSNLVFETKTFSLRTSGNVTNGTPKSSYKIGLEDDDDRLFKMKSINLKSMWNDVSQMREAVSWSMFNKAGLATPRHVYAKLCINDKYYGLYSMIEQVEKAFLKDRFEDNDKGNLYKAYWADIGPAGLERRKGSDGDDSGKQYFKSRDMDKRSYQLKTNDKSDDAPEEQTYEDLATFIRVLNGATLPPSAPIGEARFASAEFKTALDNVFDTRAFLRWASVNMLIGAWDNYWGTAANYYLYNSGHAGAARTFMEKPYFHWIPWDYDNTFGIDRYDTAWQYVNILDWEGATRGYHHGETSKLPLITNMLKHPDYVRYYLDHMEYMLDTVYNDAAIGKQIGDDDSRNGIWKRISRAAFLESDSATAAPHTGRQFTNDQVYWNGFKGDELNFAGAKILGIKHFTKMRHDHVRRQIAGLRARFPKTGETFSGARGEIPR